jgi:hypothetical protein
MSKRINAVVTDAKFDFIESVSKGNRSFVINEALRALFEMQRLFGITTWGDKCLIAYEIMLLFSGSLAEAQEARQALARLQQLYPKKWQELIKDGK